MTRLRAARATSCTRKNSTRPQRPNWRPMASSSRSPVRRGSSSTRASSRPSTARSAPSSRRHTAQRRAMRIQKQRRAMRIQKQRRAMRIQKQRRAMQIQKQRRAMHDARAKALAHARAWPTTRTADTCCARFAPARLPGGRVHASRLLVLRRVGLEHRVQHAARGRHDDERCRGRRSDRAAAAWQRAQVFGWGQLPRCEEPSAHAAFPRFSVSSSHRSGCRGPLISLGTRASPGHAVPMARPVCERCAVYGAWRARRSSVT